jgi:hypothetical protein
MNPEDLHLATMLEMTTNLSHTDCVAVITKCRERLQQIIDQLRQLRIEDPMVYGITRTWDGKIGYNTCLSYCDDEYLGDDLFYSALWLTSNREHAELKCQRCREASPESGKVWEVFEIPKTSARQLPCYIDRKYNNNPEMIG